MKTYHVFNHKRQQLNLRQDMNLVVILHIKVKAVETSVTDQFPPVDDLLSTEPSVPTDVTLVANTRPDRNKVPPKWMIEEFLGLET